MAFRCESCSAPVEPGWAEGAILTCGYCRVRQPSPFSVATELFRLDLADRAPSGITNHRARVVPGPDHAPELLVEAEAKERALQHAITTRATFDDFDARLGLRLLWGDLTTTAAGLFFRRSGAGFYGLLMSTQGSLRVQRWIGAQATDLLGWTWNDAVRKEPGAENELRVRAEGDRISISVNGQHACVLRDGAHRAGAIVVVSQSAVRHAYAIRSLVVEAVDAPVGAAPAHASQAHAALAHVAPAPGPTPARVVGGRGSPVFTHGAPGLGVPVTLIDCGPQKISVIKAVRDITNWGLREAKDAADRTPCLLGYAGDGAEAARWVAHLARAHGVARVG